MSDKWEQIKKKCSFDNGELIQVSMVDSYIQSLEQRIEDHNRVIDHTCEIRVCKSYKDRGLKCPDCPTDYRIV